MNNYNYFNNNWYRTMPNKPNLYNKEEGFIKGNLYKDLYSEYKNYQPIVPKAKDKKERLLLEVLSTDFAKHEITLYLDLHPDNKEMLDLFNKYKDEEKRLCDEYEKEYGPLNLKSDYLNSVPFTWEKDKWPWDNKQEKWQEERDFNV